MRPALTDLPHDPLHFLERPSAGIDVGAPELGAQQMLAAEDVQRQVAVLVVVAVKEAPLLMPVQRIIGGIQVQHDLIGASRCASRNSSTNSPSIASLRGRIL